MPRPNHFALVFGSIMLVALAGWAQPQPATSRQPEPEWTRELPTVLNVPATPEAGVSHALAQARAARLSDLHYALSFNLTPKAAATPASEILSFLDSGSGVLAIDYRDGVLESAQLNDHDLPVTLLNGHLLLPAKDLKRGKNVLVTTFKSNIATAGKAITRYTDKDDGSEYLYTLFVPMDASMTFPCFDQPDLKAGFTLSVTHPDQWTVVGNTPAESVQKLAGSTQTRFPETRPISTYLFAFAAGPWQRIAGAGSKQPALFVRKSQLARAQREAPEVQAMAESGIGFLEGYFQQPFPFPKYDLVLIPGFPFGGMEHAGATFLNEDGVLFRSTPTASDYFRRDILVLHETTHQWFGDLVTMRWFDDLWLKEGFAQYMAYKAMAQLKPETEPWKHFAEDIKPLAYGIDETEGTTPIFQNIPNLRDAKSAYGAIVYQKAPAVLKQLDYRINANSGTDADLFQAGLRFYLKQHAYANATWPDLIHAFEQAGATGVQAWADAWILRRGMPQVEISYTCSQGKLRSLTLKQHDVLADGYVWPITNRINLAYSQNGHIHREIVANWSTATYADRQLLGKACPVYVFANGEDQAYGRFLLDPTSESYIKPRLRSDDLFLAGGSLRKYLIWSALWENVRLAKNPPLEYVQLARPELFDEQDEASLRIQSGRVATALHGYLGPRSKALVQDRIEGTLMVRMSIGGPTGRGNIGIRIAAFRAFTSIAETQRGLQVVKDLLDEKVHVEGVNLKPLDRWNLVGHLLAMHDPEAGKYLAAETARDHSGEAQKYAFAAQAGAPDAATKARYFADYTRTTGPEAKQEDWLTQSLRPFNSWNQQALTLPYLERALNELPDIKRNRKIFFLGAWLGAFLDGQSTPEAQRIVNAWLAQPGIDHDLRLKVLENKDALDRTVRIRAAFPE